MVNVCCMNDSAAVALLVRANGPGSPYFFCSDAVPRDVVLEITARELRAPFLVRGPGEAVITTRLSREIADYAGLRMEEYLHTIALCAALQARALALNPDLRPDDFRHAQPSACLMAEHLQLEDYVALLESPRVCLGCRHFLQQLVPRDEVRALEALLDTIATSKRRIRAVSPPAP